MRYHYYYRNIHIWFGKCNLLQISITCYHPNSPVNSNFKSRMFYGQIPIAINWNIERATWIVNAMRKKIHEKIMRITLGIIQCLKSLTLTSWTLKRACVNSERINGSQLRKATVIQDTRVHDTVPFAFVVPHNHNQGCAIDYQIILPVTCNL